MEETALIDQRTPLARPVMEKLPASASKPIRKMNHKEYQAPAFGVTKTSPQKVATEFNNIAPDHNNARFSRMWPSQRERLLK